MSMRPEIGQIWCYLNIHQIPCVWGLIVDIINRHVEFDDIVMSEMAFVDIILLSQQDGWMWLHHFRSHVGFGTAWRRVV